MKLSTSTNSLAKSLRYGNPGNIARRAAPGQHGRMIDRQVDHAGAELDVGCLGDQAGEEHQGRSDRLDQIGEVLADECLAVAQLVGQDDGLHVLFETLPVVLPVGMYRLDEVRKFRAYPVDTDTYYIWWVSMAIDGEQVLAMVGACVNRIGKVSCIPTGYAHPARKVGPPAS